MSEQKKNDEYEKMMKAYEESHQPKMATVKKYELKNYFSTHLDKNTTKASKTIRILPPLEGSSTFYEVLWGHKIELDGSWKTFPCLQHEEDKPCPFCEAKQALYASGTDSDKELAKKYNAKKMYVVRVIERGNEEEGVKFWRFNYSWTKDGTLDKIMTAMKAVAHDITNPNTGRDLTLEINRNQFGIPVVNSITYPLESTTLTSNVEQGKEWLGDTRTWRDVYSTRDYDYLKIVVRGDVPVYDKTQEKFVGRKEQEAAKAADTVEDKFYSELTMENPVATETTNPVTESTQLATETATPVSETATAEEDDDLPF